MSEVTSFLAMGGYGPYVWGAYGVTAVGLTVMVLATWLERRLVARRLARAEAAAGRRRGAAAKTPAHEPSSGAAEP